MGIKSREQVVLDYLENCGSCTYQELEKLTQVSNMTVRRDVDRLVAAGTAIKTLGGIQLSQSPSNFYESSLLSRLSTNKAEKRIIAMEAIKQVNSQESLYLDGSSTSLELAKLLAKQMSGLTVITNSALVYIEIVRGVGNTVICIGGQHDPVSFCLTGATAEAEAENYFVDKVFLSTKAFMPAEGTFESSVPTFRIKQIMASRCKEVILLVDYSKFGHQALCKVLDISHIQMVITDEKTSSSDISMLEKAGKKVFVGSALNHENFATSE